MQPHDACAEKVVALYYFGGEMCLSYLLTNRTYKKVMP